MNKDFNFEMCFKPENSLDSLTFIKFLKSKEEIRCHWIDERIRTLEDEFYDLVKSYHEVVTRWNITSKWWKRWALFWEIHKINKKLYINRDLRKFLYQERWCRTYGE